MLRLALIGLLFSLSIGAGPVVALGPTGCQFTAGPGLKSPDAMVAAPTLEIFTAMARAKDRGDLEAEVAEARRAARHMVSVHGPLTIESLLDVAIRLSGARMITHWAVTAMARELLVRLDPIGSQQAEADAQGLRAYLRAHHHVHLADGSEMPSSLWKIEERIEQADICPERRFFLMLQLARNAGERFARGVARQRLEALWAQSHELSGIGLLDYPMRWLAHNQLTAAAVRVRQFDLAEAWLAVTVREAEALQRSETLDPKVKREVESTLRHFPEYVAQEHDRHRRMEAAGLY